MATCIIQLDNFQGQYYPGNTIIGKVVCSFSKVINTRGIKVTLVGQEHTAWKQTASHYDQKLQKHVTNSVSISGNNHVLEVVTTLAGEGNYPPGRHEYPFTFILPKNLPATYVGAHGSIKYIIKASVVIPFGFDHQDKKELKVVAPIDFNEIRGLQLEPQTFTSEKNVWWLFRSCGLITMKVHMEKTAFTLGEVAKVKLEITNMSTENIEKVEVHLGMVIEYNATCPTKETKTDCEKLAVASDTGVGAHGERFYLFDLTVPPSTVLPNFYACKLFKHTAEIVVTGVMKGIISNMVLTIPIELGHIPVRTQEHFQNLDYQLGPAPPYAPSSPEAYPSPTPTAPRERPPPYSVIDSRDNSPSHVYPVSPQHVPNSGIYPSLPKSGIEPKSSEERASPSAPAKEELESEDDFVLV